MIWYAFLVQISCFGTFPGGGGWVESIIKLISAEAEALLGLTELGKNVGKKINDFFKK